MSDLLTELSDQEKVWQFADYVELLTRGGFEEAIDGLRPESWGEPTDEGRATLARGLSLARRAIIAANLVQRCQEWCACDLSGGRLGFRPGSVLAELLRLAGDGVAAVLPSLRRIDELDNLRDNRTSSRIRKDFPHATAKGHADLSRLRRRSDRESLRMNAGMLREALLVWHYNEQANYPAAVRAKLTELAVDQKALLTWLADCPLEASMAARLLILRAVGLPAATCQVDRQTQHEIVLKHLAAAIVMNQASSSASDRFSNQNDMPAGCQLPKQDSADGVDEKPPTEFATAPDLAVLLQRPDLKRSLAVFLSRLAVENPECRSSVENPRKGEPRYTYRVAMVWDAVCRWVREQDRPGLKSDFGISEK